MGYQKQNFEDEQILKAEHLNHIEQGLEDAHNQLSGKQPAGDYAFKSEIPTVPVKSVNGKTGAITLSAQDVGADPSGSAESKVNTHNTNTDSHNDIRLLIEGLNTRLNALANSDDTTLDQMEEVVAYVKSNRTLIESITTSKVNVTDIINNLTTNVANKPLSASQGVVLKGLIDTLQNSVDGMATKQEVEQLSKEIDDHENNGTIHVTATEKQTWNGKVDKTAITLDKHTDGLIYIFIDGVKVGNGVEITGEVVEGDVVGTVDENNNLLLSGSLADGTYKVRYVTENGIYSDPITMVVSSIVTYAVTNNLTECSTDNFATSVTKGASYSASILANKGYELSSITVKMGGTDITSTAVNGGTINIASVTGDIVITAVAEVVQTGPTNLAKPNDAYWEDDYRLSISSGGTQACTGRTTTNFIPAKAGDVLRVKGMSITTDSNSQSGKIVMYSRKDDTSSKLGGLYGRFTGDQNSNYGNNVVVDGDVSTITLLYNNEDEQWGHASMNYIRIEGLLLDGYTAEDVIITINEEIV